MQWSYHDPTNIVVFIKSVSYSQPELIDPQSDQVFVVCMLFDTYRFYFMVTKRRKLKFVHLQTIRILFDQERTLSKTVYKLYGLNLIC